MRKGLGLDKRGKRAEGQGLRPTARDENARRLAALRRYGWSSYGAYAGYRRSPGWLTREAILERVAEDPGLRVEGYRREVRARLLKGGDTTRAEAMRDAFAVGSEGFRAKIAKLAKGGRETVVPRGLRPMLSWDAIMAGVAQVVGETPAEFMTRYGARGKVLALWAGRKFGGLTLREIGGRAGGMDYAAVSIRLKRLESRVRDDRECRQELARLDALLHVET
jgi:hypothetical protein